MENSSTVTQLSAEQYGPQYRDHYLALYQRYVDSADVISSRRYTANSFFLTINTLLLGANGYWEGAAGNLLILAALTGVVLSYTWRKLIFSYRTMNSAKFDVIIDMEQNLPLGPYGAEWAALKDRGREPPHVPFSSTEARVPLVFMVLHGLAFAYMLAIRLQ